MTSPTVLPFPDSPLSLIREYTQARGLTDETLSRIGALPVATMDDAFDLLEQNRAVWAARKAGYSCGISYPSNGNLESTQRRIRLLRSPSFIPPPGPAPFKGKYLGITRELNCLFDPPSLPTDPSSPLMLVEGAFNCARLRQDGYDAIAISGVENWTLASKRNTPIIHELPERVRLAAKDKRPFIVYFDSDGLSNPQIVVALNGLLNELSKQVPEADLHYCFPPRSEDGKKQGPDDFLQRKGRPIFDEHLRTNALNWNDSPFNRKMLEYQRYILNEATGLAFDTDQHVFSEVAWKTADSALALGSIMFDPYSQRAIMRKVTYQDYLNSKFSMRGKFVEMHPETDQVLYTCPERRIQVINSFPHHLIPEPVKNDAHIKMFYEIVDNLTCEAPSAKAKMLKLAARKVQAPLDHFPMALALLGKQGSGKSMFAQIIGMCVGSYSDAEYKPNRTNNDDWAGFLVREWSERSRELEAETLKKYIRDVQTHVRALYDKGRSIPSRTLHIITNNNAQQLVEKGDRAIIFAGRGVEVPKATGSAWHTVFGEWGRPGPGIAAVRYHLMYEVDASDLELMDNVTEIRGEVIAASQTREEDVVDELAFAISDIKGLELLPSAVVNNLLDSMGYKGNFMSLRKRSTSLATPALSEGVKIDGLKIRFIALKNLDYWRKEADSEKYREQYKLLPDIWKRQSKLEKF